MNTEVRPLHLKVLLVAAWLLLLGFWAGPRYLRELPRPIPPRPEASVLDQVNSLDGALPVLPPNVRAALIGPVRDFRQGSLEDLARRWHREWQLGPQGVLLLISPADQKARIELGWGPGDAVTESIMRDTILPACREGFYATAVREGGRRLGEELTPPDSASAAPATLAGGWFPPAMQVLSVVLMFLAAVLAPEAGRAGWVLLGGWLALRAGPDPLSQTLCLAVLSLALLAVVATARQPTCGTACTGLLSLGLLAVNTVPDPYLRWSCFVPLGLLALPAATSWAGTVLPRRVRDQSEPNPWQPFAERMNVVFGAIWLMLASWAVPRIVSSWSVTDPDPTQAYILIIPALLALAALRRRAGVVLAGLLVVGGSSFIVGGSPLQVVLVVWSLALARGSLVDQLEAGGISVAHAVLSLVILTATGFGASLGLAVIVPMIALIPPLMLVLFVRLAQGLVQRGSGGGAGSEGAERSESSWSEPSYAPSPSSSTVSSDSSGTSGGW